MRLGSRRRTTEAKLINKFSLPTKNESRLSDLILLPVGRGLKGERLDFLFVRVSAAAKEGFVSDFIQPLVSFPHRGIKDKRRTHKPPRRVCLCAAT